MNRGTKANANDDDDDEGKGWTSAHANDD